MPTLPNPQKPENAICRKALVDAFARRQYDFGQAIMASVDPACDECVKAADGNDAAINFQLGLAEDQVAYWKCRQANK